MPWQDEFKTALIEYVVAHGSLVREATERYDYGGWQDYDAYPSHGWSHECPETKGILKCAASESECPYCHTPRSDMERPPAHIKACGIDFAKTTYEDSDWQEFAGTFAEPPWESRSGTDVVAYCNCGKISGRHWRYTDSLAELIKAISVLAAGVEDSSDKEG